MKITTSFLLTFLMHSTIVNAATIQKERYGNTDLFLITVSGEITSDDAARFSSVISGVSKAIVLLDSPGGSVISGLDMGRRIKSSSFITAVPGNTMCVSSCALIWLAGSKRFAEINSYIGFHAAYVYKNGKPVESGMGNALIGAYLNSLGLTDRAVMYVTKAPPEGMERLNRSVGHQVGISYSSINDENYDAKGDISIKKSAYDPVGVVTRFYGALSNANGETASAMVIPEKRGIGPFNEKNIASFYGAMKIPLEVKSVNRTGENSVEVRYTYTYTKSQCNGVASIETEYFMENTLIKKIKANC
jgi:hypothetical protein